MVSCRGHVIRFLIIGLACGSAGLSAFKREEVSLRQRNVVRERPIGLGRVPQGMVIDESQNPDGFLCDVELQGALWNVTALQVPKDRKILRVFAVAAYAAQLLEAWGRYIRDLRHAS